MIKEVLNSIVIQECQGVEFNEIRSFVTNKPRKKNQKKRSSVPFYEERADGEFRIDMFKDEKLKSLALEIKKIVSHA